jgi:hypothetical protein
MHADEYSQNLAPSSRKAQPLQIVAFVLVQGTNLITRMFISPIFTVNPVGVFLNLSVISIILFLKWHVLVITPVIVELGHTVIMLEFY